MGNHAAENPRPKSFLLGYFSSFSSSVPSQRAYLGQNSLKNKFVKNVFLCYVLMHKKGISTKAHILAHVPFLTVCYQLKPKTINCSYIVILNSQISPSASNIQYQSGINKWTQKKGTKHRTMGDPTGNEG